MKKIFTLMLAFACALFVGVSCSTDSTDPTPAGGDPVEPTYDVTITVGELAEALPANGDTVTLNYTLSKEIAGEWLAVVESSSWLTVTAPEDQPGVLVIEALPYKAAGASPRKGSFTVAYKDAKSVEVTVLQAANTPVFEVSYSDVTPLSATATVTVLGEENQDMVWGAFTFGQSSLVQNEGGYEPLSTRAASMQDPGEYAIEWLDMAAGPMGYGGLYIYFAMMHGNGGHVSDMGAGNSLSCSLFGGYGAPEEKLYLAVVGINKKNVDLDMWTDESTMSTMVHVFEVESLPQPKLSVESALVKVGSAADCTIISYNLENEYNEYGNGVVSAESDCEWLDAATSSAGKLHLNCQENPYAIARKAEVTLTYTYTCQLPMYGEVYPMEIPVSQTVVVEQAANKSVKPLTFTLKVKETHFDHILVDVIPSNNKASYVLNAISLDQFEMYYSNDWAQCCANDLYRLDEFVHTGKLTDYKLAINTQYIENWAHHVYAYGVDVAAAAVTGEVTYKTVDVVNDTPELVLDLDYEVAPGLKLVYNEDTGNYELHTPAEGGTYTVKWNVKNAVEGGVVRTNNTSNDNVYDTNSVLAGTVNRYCDTTEWWNDAEQTFTFSVNPYDPSKASYAHYVTIYLRYYSDAEKTQGMGKAINLKVQQTAPAADPAE